MGCNGINKLYQTRHSYLQSGYRWNLSLGSTQLVDILTFARYKYTHRREKYIRIRPRGSTSHTGHCSSNIWVRPWHQRQWTSLWLTTLQLQHLTGRLAHGFMPQEQNLVCRFCAIVVQPQAYEVWSRWYLSGSSFMEVEDINLGRICQK